MVGGCTDEYEDIVCSKMGTDGCLYGEDALAAFAHRLKNTTIEVRLKQRWGWIIILMFGLATNILSILIICLRAQ